MDCALDPKIFPKALRSRCEERRRPHPFLGAAVVFFGHLASKFRPRNAALETHKAQSTNALSRMAGRLAERWSVNFSCELQKTKCLGTYWIPMDCYWIRCQHLQNPSTKAAASMVLYQEYRVLKSTRKKLKQLQQDPSPARWKSSSHASFRTKLGQWAVEGWPEGCTARAAWRHGYIMVYHLDWFVKNYYNLVISCLYLEIIVISWIYTNRI